MFLFSFVKPEDHRRSFICSGLGLLTGPFHQASHTRRREGGHWSTQEKSIFKILKDKKEEIAGESTESYASTSSLNLS
jgi:hypothetical protein